MDGDRDVARVIVGVESAAHAIDLAKEWLVVAISSADAAGLAWVSRRLAPSRCDLDRVGQALPEVTAGVTEGTAGSEHDPPRDWPDGERDEPTGRSSAELGARGAPQARTGRPYRRPESYWTADLPLADHGPCVGTGSRSVDGRPAGLRHVSRAPVNTWLPSSASEEAG